MKSLLGFLGLLLLAGGLAHPAHAATTTVTLSVRRSTLQAGCVPQAFHRHGPGQVRVRVGTPIVVVARTSAYLSRSTYHLKIVDMRSRRVRGLNAVLIDCVTSPCRSEYFAGDPSRERLMAWVYNPQVPIGRPERELGHSAPITVTQYGPRCIT